MVYLSTARTVAQAQDQARYLTSLYPSWCLLHMLLQHHKPLVSTLLLEELLDNPFAPSTSSSSTTPLSSPPNPSPSHSSVAPWSESNTSEPSHSPQRPIKASLSRHLIQRLHFGYYGNRDLLSESAVRYLTARARLEYGYFAIRGRAFWSVTQEDINGHWQPPQDTAESRKNDGESRDKKLKDTSGRQRSQQQRQQQQANQDEAAEGIDPTANKDDDPLILNNSESSTNLLRQQSGSGGISNDGKLDQFDKQHQQENKAKAQRSCEEREEILLMMEATRFCERKLPSNISPESLSPSAPFFGQLEAGIYWRQVAFTKWIISVEELGNVTIAKLPPSPFLCRRVDSTWMEQLEQFPLSSTPLLLPSQKSRYRILQELHNSQDDARLFQIATGIFDGLATHPKKSQKPARPIIDGPFKISLGVLMSLIVDHGYLPLPEDEKQRKIHYKGGNRISTGDGEKFPSDGSHVVNRRGLKGEGTSIWYFYDLQRIEVIITYLMIQAPSVLDWMFDRGFELEPTLGQGSACFSRALLLICFLPGCHAILRLMYRTPQRKFKDPVIIISRVREELLGLGTKPRRIEFQRQDFVEALKSIPAVHLEHSLAILTGIGMDRSVVQDRLVELLQIPGGPASLDVDKSMLNLLFNQTNNTFCSGLYNNSLSPMLDIQLESSESAQGDGYINPQLLQCVSGSDLVNKTIHEAFSVQMDMSRVRDRQWKAEYEEILMSFETGSWRVHPNVSKWVLDHLDSTQLAFQVCFDHSLLEALAGILEWNEAQVFRLREWIQRQENEVDMKCIPMESRWTEVKTQLLTVPGDSQSQGDKMEDVQYGVAQRTSSENWLGLNIEWTTNGDVKEMTSEHVASMPQGSELVRVSNDGHLMLDNGCLSSEFLFRDPFSGEFLALNTNENVHKFLKKDAIIEEKHLIWLALGLVTESFQGERVIEFRQSSHTAETTLPTGRSILAKMVCSPEAYQLVWMVVVAYLHQSMTMADDGSSTPVATMVSGWNTGFRPRMDSEEDEQSQQEYEGNNHHMRTPTPTLSQGSYTSWVSKVRALKLLLTDRLGLDAWLMIEIMNEIEDDLEDALGVEDHELGDNGNDI